jgi:hypothetical protein
MSTAIGQWPSRLKFYVLAVVIAAAVLVFVEYMFRISYHQTVSGIVSSTSLNQSDSVPIPPWEQKGLEVYATMSGLLITLATALLGGLGYLLTNERKTNPQLRHAAAAVGSALFAVLSILFGYISHLAVLTSTTFKSFDAYGLGVIWPSRSQFYTLLLAVFLFADFAFHELGKEARRERS